MKINWKVRLKNKTFWVTVIPAILVLVQAVAALFGFSIELEGIGSNILAVVEAAFVVLAVVGIVNDPTTAGVSDSEQAMSYEKPKE